MTSPAKLLAAEQARCRRILERAIDTRQAAALLVMLLIDSLARAERAIGNGDITRITQALDDLRSYGD